MCNKDFIAIPWICSCLSGGFCISFFCCYSHLEPTKIRVYWSPPIGDTALSDQTTSQKSSLEHVAENDAEQRFEVSSRDEPDPPGADN